MSSQLKVYHHGDLRNVLLWEAESMLERGGGAALSLRELAKAVGVSPNAPYRHFPDKDALLAALATRGFLELSDRFRQHEVATPDLRLAVVVHDYVEMARERPGRFRIMFRSRIDKDSPYPALAEAAHQAFLGLLEAIYPHVRGPANETTLKRLAVIAWSLIHGFSSLVLDGAVDPDHPAIGPADIAEAVQRASEHYVPPPTFATTTERKLQNIGRPSGLKPFCTNRAGFAVSDGREFPLFISVPPMAARSDALNGLVCPHR